MPPASACWGSYHFTDTTVLKGNPRPGVCYSSKRRKEDKIISTLQGGCSRHYSRGLVGGICFNKKLIMFWGTRAPGVGKWEREVTRVLHNNTLAPWEYFRMCGLLKSEGECPRKSVTHPPTAVTGPGKTALLNGL